MVGAVIVGVATGSIGWLTAISALFACLVAIVCNQLLFLRRAVAKVKKPVVRCLQLVAAFAGGALLAIIGTSGMGWVLPTASVLLVTTVLWKRNGATTFVRAVGDTFNDLSLLFLLVLLLLIILRILIK